jgi:hypothetical protein
MTGRIEKTVFISYQRVGFGETAARDERAEFMGWKQRIKQSARLLRSGLMFNHLTSRAFYDQKSFGFCAGSSILLTNQFPNRRNP